MNEPAVLFVKPGAIKANDKGRLSKAGIIVVEIEDPAAVKLVRAGMELSHSDLLMAAMQAITPSDYTCQSFGKAVAAAIEAAHKTK